MIPRILAIVAPLLVYASLALLLWGLYRQRHRTDLVALALAGLALASTFLLVQPAHRLYFDEDIYINIATNLSRVPAAQLTLLGGPDSVEVATYYKAPVGFPVLLSLVFMLFGASEAAAFVVARFLFAATVASVYLLGTKVLPARWQAAAAAMVFAAAPVALEFSTSAGTDMSAVLFATLGMWGLLSGNGALAAAGLALASQTRLEAIVLIPLLLFTRLVPWRWKVVGAALAATEVLQVQWILSTADRYAEAIRVESAFSWRYIGLNLMGTTSYLLDYRQFPVLIAVLAALALAWKFRRRTLHGAPYLGAWIVLFVAVYLIFYAGSFGTNPRYSLQILVPMALLAVSVLAVPGKCPLPEVEGIKVKVVRCLPALAVAVTFVPTLLAPRDPPDLVTTLASDHRIAAELASKAGADTLVVATEPEVFINHGARAMNAVFASERPEKLAEQFAKYRRLWYYAGARTSIRETEQWTADRWIKAHYELRLIDSQEIRGMSISLFQILPNPVNREARLVQPFERQRDR